MPPMMRPLRKNEEGRLAPPLRFKRKTNDQQPPLRSLAPPRQILFLLRRQVVDLDSERLQLQFGDPLVEIVGDFVNPVLQTLVILYHVLGGESLVRKAHVHDGWRVSFGGSQVDQAAFAEQVDLAPVAQ